jgi:hypothetical protein
MAVVLIVGILWIVVALHISRSHNPSRRRLQAFLLAGIASTLYSFMTHEWLFGCVIIMLIFANCEIREVMKWMDAGRSGTFRP